MTTHGVDTALTLFASGTLTRTQAARRAGVSPERFDRLCRRQGIEPVTPTIDAGGASPANAD